MTTIQVKVPDGTDISGYEAEWRIANSGETIVTWTGTIVEFGGANDGIGRIVLTPKWKPPEWLKPGYLVRDRTSRDLLCSQKPVWNAVTRNWVTRGPYIDLTNFTTFERPDVEPKDSLIEVH